MKTIACLLVAAGLSLGACSPPAPGTENRAPAPPATTAAPAAGPVAALPPTEVARELARPGVVLLDVRTPAEFALGHLPNARNLNFRADDFARQVAQLDSAKSYVLYCASGNRSGQAARLMREQGFPNVVNGGGYDDLKAATTEKNQ